MKWLPAGDRHERMMSRHLDTTTSLGGHGETWLYPAVNPIANVAPFDSSSWRQSKDDWSTFTNDLFDGETSARDRVIDERACHQTFPDAWASCNDDQI